MLVKIFPVFAAAAVSAAIGYGVGMPLARFLEGEARMRWLVAPALGLGVFTAVATTLFHFIPLNPISVVLLSCMLAALAHVSTQLLTPSPLISSPARPTFLWLAAAVTISLAPALALAPQHFGASVSIGTPIWDHVKIAIIDEIAQNGLPVHNPFYSDTTSSNLLVYYYAWYVLAACASVVSGATGWETDIGLTAITALCSIFVLAWLAVGLSRRWRAAWWLLPMVLAGSLGNNIPFIFGDWFLDPDRVFGLAWIYQASWAPQHLFAATILILAVALLIRLLSCPDAERSTGLLLGTMVAAAFGASTWVGGFGAALVLPILTLFGLPQVRAAGRVGIVVHGLFIASIAVAVGAGLLLYEQLGAFGQRKALVFWICPVLHRGSVENLFDYWLILLPKVFGCLYLLAVPALIWGERPADPARRLLRCALIWMSICSLISAQFVRSVIVNNDFGWRIVLLAMFGMAALASGYLAAKTERRIGNETHRRLIIALVILILTPSVASGLLFLKTVDVNYWLHGPETPEGRALRLAPEMWSAVRAVTPPDEAIANNPMDSASLTPAPGNISWALLARRRNCATAYGHLSSYAAQLSGDDVARVFSFFVRVFKGDATAEDLATLKSTYACRTLVVTPADGLWDSPLLVDNPTFKLVDQRPNRWRIYR